MGALFSGLLKGFSGSWEKHATRQHEEEMENKKLKISILEHAANDPNLTDAAREQIMHDLMDITGQSKNAKKHGILGLFGGSKGSGDKGQPKGASQPPQKTGEGQPQKAQPQALGNPPAPPQGKQSQAQGGLGAPPAPPGQMTMTHGEQEQRKIQDQIAEQQALHAEAVKEGREEKQEAITGFMNDYKKVAGQDPSPEVKDRFVQHLYGVDYKETFKPTPGAQPEQDGQGRWFRRTYDQQGKEGPPEYVGAPKQSATQEKFDQKVKDFQSANPPKKDESPEDYNKRSQMAVHKMQFQKDMNGLIDSGLRRLGVKLSNAVKEKMLRDYADNGTMSRKMANILRNGAAARAKRRMEEYDPADQGKNFDQLVEEELNAIGTNGAELEDVLGKPASGGGKGKSSGSSGGLQIGEDGTVTIPAPGK